MSTTTMQNPVTLALSLSDGSFDAFRRLLSVGDDAIVNTVTLTGKARRNNLSSLVVTVRTNHTLASVTDAGTFLHSYGFPESGPILRDPDTLFTTGREAYTAGATLNRTPIVLRIEPDPQYGFKSLPHYSPNL